MILVQLTGLSEAGKTTLAQRAKVDSENRGYAVEVVDADVYRQRLWPELTVSPADRQETIRRLAYVGQRFCRHNLIAIPAPINPYASTRAEVATQYPTTRTVYVCCDLPILLKRAPKGLYAGALLPNHHPDKLTDLTAINDSCEPPRQPGLVLDPGRHSEDECTVQFVRYLIASLPAVSNR